jgi:hypothetical protein
MATIPLPPDFSVFLKLLNKNDVRYLVIGGYAVGYHGYIRATADLDVWISRDPENADRIVAAVTAFGFGVSDLNAEMFLTAKRVIRMGYPPMRIELMTSVSGVEFEQCFAERIVARWDDVDVNLISLERLKENKQASGRLKDLTDLEYLD